MKKIAFALAAVLLLTLCLTGCGGKEALTLNVYNWGEYISDGSEGSFDTVREFEKWYQETYNQKVTVNYTTFASNEDMYNKISSGAVSYDVIIPSDYMIARMAGEGLLQTLNFDNIPNYQYIDDNFKGLYYDAENQYSVPYTYGIVGVIYDGNVVDAADANGWDLLWNEKYSNRILQFNNSRDAFGTAMYKLGIDVNTTDKAEWDRAYDELLAQRPLVYSYVMDEIFNMMESGEAAVGAYYAGDYFTMKDAQADNVDLLCGRHVHSHLCAEQGVGGNLHQLHAFGRCWCGQRRIHLLRLPQQPCLQQCRLHRRDGRGSHDHSLSRAGQLCRAV